MYFPVVLSKRQWLLANHLRTNVHVWLFLCGIRFRFRISVRVSVSISVRVRLKVPLTSGVLHAFVRV